MIRDVLQSLAAARKEPCPTLLSSPFSSLSHRRLFTRSKGGRKRERSRVLFGAIATRGRGEKTPPLPFVYLCLEGLHFCKEASLCICCRSFVDCCPSALPLDTSLPQRTTKSRSQGEKLSPSRSPSEFKSSLLEHCITAACQSPSKPRRTPLPLVPAVIEECRQSLVGASPWTLSFGEVLPCSTIGSYPHHHL